jgi:hypothetical protein
MGLICKIFGHDYPMILMYSTVLYGLAGEIDTIRRKECTCQCCGHFDKVRYDAMVKEYEDIKNSMHEKPVRRHLRRRRRWLS